MDSNQSHPVRPRTMWLGPKRKRDLDLEIEQASRSRLCPSEPQPQTSTTASPLARPAPAQHRNQPKIRQIDEDPWLTYEPIVRIFGRPVFLARLRSNKAELVNIQRLEKQPSSAQSLVETMHQVAHRSFPDLLEHYRHEGQDFLVWEALELSVGQVLGSRCSIDEGALAAIVWPVLKGIKHLRGQGRVLATLSPDTIFLTESGVVKIAGAEHSCQIDATEMDAATLKLMALADVVQNLMTRSSSGTEWSPEAQSLPEDLNRLSVDDLLRSKFFEQLGSGGELKMLVNVVNKDACHKIDFLSCA
ncbi:uncharacterized protein N7446_007919 [Penicillium canescens]|uniref:uncharacterized protein n=1 Tax=Penicillium canescens TaxID=5083 RepID=UPI0026E00FB8|nr:uncharacterized protein N7446_007919 [Penicillium canescens]KAJ6058336.1 hypothetical protein N7446_007919 [Penicillium canescens]